MGANLTATNVSALANAAKKMPVRERHGLVRRVDSLLRRGSRREEGERVAAAKLLVALLPGSWQTIERWLSNTDDRWCYELHFSLFCFLDDAQFLPIADKVKQTIHDAVAHYLFDVRRGTAKAAWMAGDLLGDHWKSPEVVSTLAQISRRAPSAAGRLGALHGLAQRLRKSGGRDRVRILDTMRSISREDHSRKIRAFALSIISRANREQLKST